METEFLNLIKEAFEIEDRMLDMADRFKEFDEWDSLTQLTLIAELDEKFGVVIKMDDFKNITTLLDLYNEILSRKA
ncbi:MAG: acyl carrier protein [Flavobacteriales bacterium]|nr:acyl carrier protein [Flavobacteriales bacterium]